MKIETKKIKFARSYKLTATAVNPLKGYVGLYLIYLDNLRIPYPFNESRVIYIEKSDSKQYNIGGRLKDHMTGSGNTAVYNYAKNTLFHSPILILRLSTVSNPPTLSLVLS